MPLGSSCLSESGYGNVTALSTRAPLTPLELRFKRQTIGRGVLFHMGEHRLSNQSIARAIGVSIGFKKELFSRLSAFLKRLRHIHIGVRQPFEFRAQMSRCIDCRRPGEW